MCGFACGDPRAVPSVAAPPDLQAELDAADGGGTGGGGGGGTRGGRQAAAPTPQEQQQELGAQALALARRGGEAVLQSMARLSGPRLQQQLPKLWEQASAPLAAVQQAAAAADLQAAVHALHVLVVLAPAVHPDLVPQLQALLPLVGRCLQHPNAAVKLAAARSIAALARAHTTALMPPILRLLAPLLEGGRRRSLLAPAHALGRLAGTHAWPVLCSPLPTTSAACLPPQAAHPTTPAWAPCWRCMPPWPPWAWPWCLTRCWWWCR